MTADKASPWRARRQATTGATVGLFLTAALTGWLFFGWKFGDLPFWPFDLFDWIGRVLPGPVVTLGIDSIVSGLRLVGLSPADSAKSAEQLLAVALFLAIGAAWGAWMFTLGQGARRSFGLALGVVMGFVAAFLSLAVSANVSAGVVEKGVASVWLIASFSAWGLALGWSHDRLAAVAATPTPAAGRRRFLTNLAAVSAGIVVAGGALGTLAGRRLAAMGEVARNLAIARWSASNPLPNASAGVRPAPGTRPEFTPLDDHYRIDINTRVPEVDGATWRLKVDGLVGSPAELSLPEIQDSHEPHHEIITLACISNRVGGDLIGTTRWTGVSLRDLVDDWGLAPEATHLKLTSVDGFFEIVALETIRADERVMLAYAWDGVPLTPGHGFPLRVYIPDHYGMKQPKWIVAVEAIAEWEPGYWVGRGWSKEARMNATAVIDTVSSDMMAVDAKAGSPIPIGGIAHAGARGISKVEVRVDDGPWNEAELRDPLSPLTWVVWRYDWPLETGEHEFTVRCVDGEGVAQIETVAPVRPDGATGYHSMKATF